MKTGPIGLKIDLRNLVKSSFLHTKGSWAMRLGHGEAFSRQPEKERSVAEKRRK